MYHSAPKSKSINTIYIDKEINWMLKDVPCENDTRTSAVTKMELENIVYKN